MFLSQLSVFPYDIFYLLCYLWWKQYFPYKGQHEVYVLCYWDMSSVQLPETRELWTNVTETIVVPFTEATQEAEVSKRRRDWAFSERDKIVLERESIRTLCDRLRKERDRAVSDLAEALRDSDDIKKQRNEASKELKDLKYVYLINVYL
jgi:hypothetical protein